MLLLLYLLRLLHCFLVRCLLLLGYLQFFLHLQLFFFYLLNLLLLLLLILLVLFLHIGILISLVFFVFLCRLHNFILVFFLILNKHYNNFDILVFGLIYFLCIRLNILDDICYLIMFGCHFVHEFL